MAKGDFCLVGVQIRLLTRCINLLNLYITYYWVYLSSDHTFQVYYKVRQVLLQIATISLQSATEHGWQIYCLTFKIATVICSMCFSFFPPSVQKI